MKTIIYAIALTLSVTQAKAIIYNETESNNTPATANQFLNLNSGDRIQGNFAPGATWDLDADILVPDDKDYFKVNGVQNLPFGIYRHSIENIPWPNGFTLNSNFVTGGNPSWYSFGSGGSVSLVGYRDVELQLFSQPVPYDLEYRRQLVTARNLIDVSSGDITLTIPNTNLARLFNTKIFDSAGNHMAGIGGQFTTGTVNFSLANGTYYIVIGQALQAGNEVFQGFRMGSRTFRDHGGSMDPIEQFASLTLSSGSLNQVIPFGQHVTPSDPAIYKLSVVPEPASLGTVLIGLLLANKKRKKKSV